jgi:tetratricopeptide (TPR) repeat protein
MNRWALVAIPLMFCLVLMDVVIRQFVADRAFQRAKAQVEKHEKEYALHLAGSGRRPASISSVGPALRKAVKIEPRCAEYHSYLGRYYQAMASDPGASDAERMRSIKQAIQQYEKAVQLDPLNGVYHAYLAYSEGVTGEHEKAVAHFEKAIALNRSNEWIQRMYDAYRRWVAPEGEEPEVSEGEGS